MKISISDCSSAKTFTKPTPWAAISIATLPRYYVTLQAENRMGLLRLAFADISNPDIDILEARDGTPLDLFDEEMAVEILSFAHSMFGLGVSDLLVHCEAGISRSAGVAIALCELSENADSVRVINTCGFYHPNDLVKTTILKAARSRDIRMVDMCEYHQRHVAQQFIGYD